MTLIPLSIDKPGSMIAAASDEGSEPAPESIMLLPNGTSASVGIVHAPPPVRACTVRGCSLRSPNTRLSPHCPPPYHSPFTPGCHS